MKIFFDDLTLWREFGSLQAMPREPVDHRFHVVTPFLVDSTRADQKRSTNQSDSHIMVELTSLRELRLLAEDHSFDTDFAQSPEYAD
jgi:hypothetical protein